MNDWQAGDLALCVNDGLLVCDCAKLHNNRSGAVQRGHIYTIVSEQGAGSIDKMCEIGGCDCPTLGTTSGNIALTKRFRKIHPHTPDAEDAETIRLLNSKERVLAPIGDNT